VVDEFRSWMRGFIFIGIPLLLLVLLFTLLVHSYDMGSDIEDLYDELHEPWDYELQRGSCVESWTTNDPAYIDGYNTGYSDAVEEYKFAPEGKPSDEYNEIEAKCVECWHDGYAVGLADQPDCGMKFWDECEVVIPCILSGSPGCSADSCEYYKMGYTKGYSYGWNEGFTECEMICEELLNECK